MPECRVCGSTEDLLPVEARYKNPRCRKCKNAAYRAYRKHPHVKKIARNGALKRRYGIDLEEYKRMLSQQNGGCAICMSPPSEGDRWVLNVDHCHITGRVRGLLCIKCNTAIGKLNDDPELLHRAAEYLEERS